MVNILSIDTTNKDKIIRKCAEISWCAVSNHKMPEGPEKRKKSNEIGYRAVKHILELLRINEVDVAIEIGMVAIQMFYDGHNYHQVLSCVEGLKDDFKNSRLIDDVVEYETNAKSAIEKPNPNTMDGKIDILYNLVWENGCLGTSDAINFYKKLIEKPITEPTVLSYCRMLKYEQRIVSFGGPTGRPIEMFPNNSISLNREESYKKVNFFEGNLVAKLNLFNPVWDAPYRKNTFVYEVQNGNDPRVFALIEPGVSIPPKFKKMGLSLSNMPGNSGVEGTLYPIKSMPDFGFKPIEELNDADFLTGCKVRPLMEF